MPYIIALRFETINIASMVWSSRANKQKRQQGTMSFKARLQGMKHSQHQTSANMALPYHHI